MSYINPIFITDKYVKDLLDRDGLAGQLALTDLAVNRFVQSKGVSPSLIPMDDEGVYTTSFDVLEYALAHLYSLAFKDYIGVDMEDYREKYYIEKNTLRSKMNKATYDTILSNLNKKRSSFYKDVPAQ